MDGAAEREAARRNILTGERLPLSPGSNGSVIARAQIEDRRVFGKLVVTP
jgi:hypothetical protein